MPNNLKSLRESKGLTLRELATQTMTNDTTISRIENGQQSMAEHYANIFADFFKCSTDYLLGRTERIDSQEKIQYIDREVTYHNVISKLNSFSSKELLNLSGAIDYILEERSKTTPNQQLIKNKLESVVRKESNN